MTSKFIRLHLDIPHADFFIYNYLKKKKKSTTESICTAIYQYWIHLLEDKANSAYLIHDAYLTVSAKADNYANRLFNLGASELGKLMPIDIAEICTSTVYQRQRIQINDTRETLIKAIKEDIIDHEMIIVAIRHWFLLDALMYEKDKFNLNVQISILNNCYYFLRSHCENMKSVLQRENHPNPTRIAENICGKPEKVIMNSAIDIGTAFDNL
jgi:hypothetical protein